MSARRGDDEYEAQLGYLWVGLTAVLGFLTLLAVGIILAMPVRAHSWYDPWCCGGLDCKVVAREDLSQSIDGWIYLPGGQKFESHQIYPSKDSNFHACIGVGMFNKGTPYCLYVVQDS